MSHYPNFVSLDLAKRASLNAASYLAGEIEQPRRRLPQAILLGTGLVVALYLALNTVYGLALSVEDVRQIVNDLFQFRILLPNDLIELRRTHAGVLKLLDAPPDLPLADGAEPEPEAVADEGPCGVPADGWSMGLRAPVVSALWVRATMNPRTRRSKHSCWKS